MEANTNLGPGSVESVLFEARSSAIGGDVDEAGRRILVFEDRVELRDGAGQVLGRVGVFEITRLRIRRRLSSAIVEISGRHGTGLELRGVKPAAAAGVRETLAALHLDAFPAIDTTPTAEMLRRYKGLADLGLLTRAELAERRFELTRRPEGR